MAHALFKAAVAGYHPRAVVNEVTTVVIAKDSLRDRHTHTVGNTLAERTGRHLDRGGDAALGVTRRARMGLTERTQVINAQVVTKLVRERVLQDATVSIAQNESVAVAPKRVGRVVSHDATPERHAEWCECHCGAAVTGLRRCGGVHSHRGDFANDLSFEFGRSVEHVVSHGYESSELQGANERSDAGSLWQWPCKFRPTVT